ncbi:hypothetical protein NGH74_13760 [Staphylococcus pseudoxylosus]|uniref:hypothetical protein n=1 Tax=Staphylococcus pseudoxylosus TaxID=2282419 RepID=UPI002DBAB142|nr:hypothetical protein [Staphylococcus pseudoxylosus]MEB8088227.1 hypothetical protein [Staphylococcus pseudoxylosus]
MKYTIQQLEDEFELSRNFTIEYDESLDVTDFADTEQYTNAIMESTRVVPDEWAPYTEINID